MNYDIHYVIDYRYGGLVTDNLNTLRVRPANTNTQRCEEFKVRLDPEARIQRHIDYFGTEVLEFGVARPHDHLKIDIRARVSTTEPALPPINTWADLTSLDYGVAGIEFLLPADDNPRDQSVTDLVDAVATDSPTETAQLLCQVIPDRFEYRPGATYVSSSINDLLVAGAGVCQDFVHLGLILLRRHGIAARYVSGYLFSDGGDGSAASVEVQTHAWIEALLPVPGGLPMWVGIDPTNRTLTGTTHVKIGHGRHYTDVPPTKGVYFGSAGADLTAAVTMTRLEPTPA